MTMNSYIVTTVARKGALPHTARVTAASKAQAFVLASQAHRKAQGLPPQVSLTCVSSRPAPTLPKPVLNF